MNTLCGYPRGMTRQLRKQWKRQAEKELLGGQPRENFDQETLDIVDATTELWIRLAKRGWTPFQGGVEFMWEFNLRKVSGESSLHYWQTPAISGGYTPFRASVVLTGDINEPEPGEEPTKERYCTFADLTDERLSEIENMRVGDPEPEFWR